MKLSEYQWSHNPRGLHQDNIPAPVRAERFRQINCGWAKLVVLDTEQMPSIAYFHANNITPIIRLYRERPGALPHDSKMINTMQAYIAAGVKWFEIFNEPNFEIEWPKGAAFTYADIPGTIAPLMESWLNWADALIGLGGYPAFPALGEQTNTIGDVTSWLHAMLVYLAEHHYERFRNIANNGMWVATHPYFYNHFYQEGATRVTPRQPHEQRADEPGWHFEYPFDPLTQAYSPGLTTISGPPEHPRGDPIGLVGMGHAFMHKFGEMFGGGAVPVIGTEGGITPPPVLGQTQQQDSRFPGVTWESHAEATLASFNWIAQQGPPWMFGNCLWIEGEIWDGPHGELKLVQRLTTTSPYYKSVPPVEAIDGPGPGWKKLLKGPGKIHGSPDYHFVVVAAGLNTNWFFTRAHEYYEMFRPTVVSSVDFIAYIPPEKSLACTVIATPDMVDYMTHHIKDRWPNVWFDLIVAENEAKIASTLAQRTESKRRFG